MLGGGTVWFADKMALQVGLLIFFFITGVKCGVIKCQRGGLPQGRSPVRITGRGNERKNEEILINNWTFCTLSPARKVLKSEMILALLALYRSNNLENRSKIPQDTGLTTANL
jgi:hypothetical protein